MAYIAPASSFPENLPQTEIEIQSQPKFHINPSSAASSSTLAYPDNNSRHYYYQVFLNHRGPDVKKTFASHLYHRLVSYGFKVFFDKTEMQKGDSLTSQIEGAIRSASVHVAIFSPGYADSSWCLNELLQMLGSGTTIIPVFYNVKPDELRWTQGRDGVYAQALHNLENKKTFDSQTDKQKPRYDSSTIQNWRNALSQVAGLSGFELQEACNGGLLPKEEMARMNVFCIRLEVGTLALNKPNVDKILSRFQRIGKLNFLPFNLFNKCTRLAYVDAHGNWHLASKGAAKQI